MKTKPKRRISDYLLPKTPTEISNGGVYVQHVRCGKKNCRCARGELHTAYYFIARSQGRQYKIYVPKSELARMRELVEESRFIWYLVRTCVERADRALRRARQPKRKGIRGSRKSIPIGDLIEIKLPRIER